jgi:2,3-bisphosphoglycerate-dependent phosphoglycerate mutase
MTRLLCIRHGETDHNAAGQICTHTVGASLSDIGRQQTVRLAERLTAKHVAVVYTSPLPRAVETAEILATALEVPVLHRAGLTEISAGELDGRSDEEAYEILNTALDGWSRGNLDLRIGKLGDTGHDVVKRCAAEIERMAAEYPGQTIAAVTHGGYLQIAIPWACTNLEPVFGLRRHVGNAAVIELEVADRVRCVAWEDQHLSGGPAGRSHAQST